MSADRTARLGLPLLHAAQAQKEESVNEALAALDLAMPGVVEAAGVAMPPATPQEGACWATGADPGGAWAGHPLALAGWTAAGWRFVPAMPGQTVWSRADGVPARRTETGWSVGAATASELVIGGDRVVGARQPGIAAPAGGETIDEEARVAIGAILAALQQHGLIADP